MVGIIVFERLTLAEENKHRGKENGKKRTKQRDEAGAAPPRKPQSPFLPFRVHAGFAANYPQFAFFNKLSFSTIPAAQASNFSGNSSHFGAMDRLEINKRLVRNR